MNAAIIEQKLQNERQYWQSVERHMVEQASMDSQSHYTFQMAQDKLAALDHTLRRIQTGSFGYCDECGGAIEPERLKLLIDSDRHVCAECAQAMKARRTNLPTPRRARPTYGRLNIALEMA